MKTWRFLLPIVVAAVTSIAAIAVAAAIPPATDISMGVFMAHAFKRAHCFFSIETVAPPGKQLPGFMEISMPPPPIKLTENAVPGFLRKNLKGYSIFPDRINKSVVHIIARRLLKWKANPLDHRLTICGKMTLNHAWMAIINPSFPQVSFGTMVVGELAAASIGQNVLIRFDLKNVTLRRFLTTGIPYCRYPGNGNPLRWEAVFYQSTAGRLTGCGDVYTEGRVCPPRRPTAEPATGKK